MKRLRTVALFFWVLLTVPQLSGTAAAESLLLKDLLVEADRNNPELLATQAQVAVAESRIDQVSTLQDPVLSLSFSSYPIDELKSNVTPMTGNEVRLAQKFPFPGKLDTRGEIAAQRVRWFASAYQDSRLQIRQQIKDAWYRLQFQQQAIALTERNLAILNDFIRLTETRYEVGKGLQQNVLKAHLQYSKQLDKLLTLKQQSESTLAELNSLVGRETDRPVDVTALQEPPVKGFELLELQRQAEQKRPMYSAFDALINQYKEQRGLARLDSRPDITVWGGYRWRDNGLADGGTDFVSAGVSFNLPVYRSRIDAGIAEADSQLRVAYRKRDNFQRKVNLAIHQAVTSYNQAGELARLYREGILPQARQTFQASLSSYQVDKVDFLSLLDSLMNLYRNEIDYARTLSEQWRSQARIEAAAGLEIDELPQAPKPIEG